MGSFSWLKADNLTNVSNIAYGMPFKFLIPIEFGGGFIKDVYQDYGDLGRKPDGSPKYDMYELLAFWNTDPVDQIVDPTQRLINRNKNRMKLKFDGKFPLMKEVDEYTEFNRLIGINIGCQDKQIDKLKYPLKLVSVSFKGTYEDCQGKSFGDPNHGFTQTKRKKVKTKL